MSRFWMLACACAAALALVAAPAKAENPAPPAKKAEKADPTEQLLAKLEQESQLREGTNLNEIPLVELLQDFSKRYGVTFIINADAFKAAGLPDVTEAKPTALATQLRGLPVRQVLNLMLESMGATYLVRRNTIEIVPVQFAAKVTKSATTESEDGRPRLNEPLVSVVFKEKSLNEAVAKVAEMYDLTITIAAQAGDAKTGFVTARILNMPADKAVELLALQCDLRVVRRGTAYMLTSKDHANELFNERLDKERQRIEVEQLRKGPPKPPAPDKALQFKGGVVIPQYPDLLPKGTIPFSGTFPVIPGQQFSGMPLGLPSPKP